MPRLRVFVIGPHDMNWDGVRNFLKQMPEMETVGDTTNLEHALEAAVAVHPGVVLTAAELRGSQRFPPYGGFTHSFPQH